MSTGHHDFNMPLESGSLGLTRDKMAACKNRGRMLAEKSLSGLPQRWAGARGTAAGVVNIATAGAR